MDKEIENPDSSNEENPIEVEETDDADALSDQNRRLAEQNRQLFARAKKAEGFELKDGKWVKEKPKEKPKEDIKPEASPESDDIDFAQLAFYNTTSELKIKDEDIDFLRNQIKETGKSQKDILASKWFAAELKERQEARAVQNATPKSTKRAGKAGDTLDIAFAKYQKSGELPEDLELRAAIVEKRIEQEKAKNQFTSTPIVEG